MGSHLAGSQRHVGAARKRVIRSLRRYAVEIVEACDGCDVLVHEVYSTKGFATRTPPWQKYHADAHTSSEELADLAGRARPRLLVLYHQLYWGATDDELLQEVRQRYRGAVVSARDLGIY